LRQEKFIFCRYELVSYSDTYDDYLLALKTPALLLPHLLTTRAKMNITIAVKESDDGEKEEEVYRWEFITGEEEEEEAIYSRELLSSVWLSSCIK
jgi:hypothetical protein